MYFFPSISMDHGAHLALDRADGPVGVGDGLALGDLADQHLAGLREPDHGRGRPVPLGVGDDDGLARLEHADDRVGGAEVDSDGLGHDCASVSVRSLRPTGHSVVHRLLACTVYDLESHYSNFLERRLCIKTMTRANVSYDHRWVRGYGRRYASNVPDLVLLRHGQSDLERGEPLHRVGRRGPDRQGRGRGASRPGAPGRRGADSRRPPDRDRPHLGADPGGAQRQPRPRRAGPRAGCRCAATGG